MAKLLSLVIPTRERAELLDGALRAAVSVEDPNLEIVVSDNASEDHTSEVVSRFSDPRVKYFRLEERVSMRANFESALSRSTGEYVIFIGDDDGVLATGMAMLRRFLETADPDAVAWPQIGYTWPSDQPGQDIGYVHVKRSSVYGGIRQQSPRDLQRRLLAGKLRSYRDSANIYHGCVARRVIESVSSRNGGVYFAGAIPDVYASIANLTAMSRPLVWLDHPITFGGVSDRSQGANSVTGSQMTEAGKAEVRKFAAESAADEGASNINVSVPSVDALTLDMLLLQTEFIVGESEIDWRSWMDRIARRLARLPVDKYTAGVDAITDYCKQHDREDVFTAALARRPRSAGNEASIVKRPTRSKIRLSRITLTGRLTLATVAQCAQALDEIIGPHDPARPRKLLSWPRALCRAYEFSKS